MERWRLRPGCTVQDSARGEIRKLHPEIAAPASVIDAWLPLKPLLQAADARRVRTRARNILTFTTCLLWVAAGLCMLIVLLPGAEQPSLQQLLVLVGCTTLALALNHARVHGQRGVQRFRIAPDAGLLVLIAVLVDPPWAALAGSIALLHSIGHAGTRLERVYLASGGALATGTASMAAHATFTGSTPATREVIVAALVAATVRTFVLLGGQLLLAESRTPGGALALLRAIPVSGVLVLEAGLPIASVAMAAPFIDQVPLAMAIVLAGQLLTWRVLRLQDEHLRSELITGELLDTFHRYVPRHVAEQILASGGSHVDIALAGERREISVMFIDIRGFTSWTERTDPNEVFAELNQLLGELADAILSTGGTLDKFTGDGLMALWNAPADQPDHAVRAVRTLPTLLMRVREFNIRREVQRSTPLEVGIGIATGPATVGNIGHRDRLAYTAIGDTVNLAARLEKATAAHDVPALIDERTFLALPVQLQRQLMRLESIEVKGRSERVRLYAPAALVKHRTRRDGSAA